MRKSKRTKLLDAQREGYVFHGSPRAGVEILEPRPAIDVDKSNTFNNDNAVFASKYPEASVIFACIAKFKVPSNDREGNWTVDFSKKKNSIVAKIPLKWKKYISNDKGYVYILPGDSFRSDFGNKESSHWQVKSKEQVDPIDVVEVRFKDFEELGGLIEWTE